MREIKFKIYDTVAKKWVHKEPVNLFGECIIMGYVLGHPDSHAVGIGEINNLVALQYTGLKDKDGKEIFEGDVCKKTYGSSTPIFAVEYHEARCAFIMQDGYNELLYTINPNMIEIIGNIYSNPELLGGVK